MKTRAFTFTVVAALAGLLTFSAGALAARPPDAGNGGGGGDMEPPDYGDLIILYRDDNGVPIPSPETQVPDPETGELVDGGLCWQPIAFNVDDELLCPAECVVASVPPGADVVDVNQFNCGVTTGCANCTQEVDFGRVNSARSPVEVFDRQLEDVVVNLAIADCTTLDPAGRLVASTVAADETVTTKTIDSPLQNLAIYRQLMLTGFLGAEASPIELPAGTLDTAARGLGVGSDKTGEVNVDMVAYLNSIMGLDDVPTILGKLCETYREEVQGTIQLVEKCYLNYGPEASDIPPTPVTSPADYLYTRSVNFSTTEPSLPLPAYIPDDAPLDGWFEYLALVDPPITDENLFRILQGPILDAVFPDTPFVEFDGGNIAGFAQAADDTRAVINFMHDWPVPDAAVYATPVPCVASGDIAYDVSISEESGLQVPMTYVNGTDREFIVTVANAGPDAATGTVTVIAAETNGAPIDGSPWVYEFTDLGAGFSASFDEPFMIDLGRSTTINWEATAEAEFDVNPLNNTVTATTSVRNTGGGGGGQGGKP
jgi:hypothetical protein